MLILPKNYENICLKCGEYICKDCSKEHKYPNDKFVSLKDYSISSVLNSQFYCKDHSLKITHYCHICKIHLCNNEYLSEHHHINCHFLNQDKKYQKLEINCQGDNKTLSKLLLIAK